ncbi:RHS repeat-associated core domain-containing protein [Pseudomonas beijingensis]|uniref:RHS repeat-associated core domain-containing protein n=1 Tax=Pseudomonas beijingensis TaxID=2954101 RepID=UPI002734A471|nr:RHS repeat-associated core domain-containing protein [Pseudomonas sp. FP2262]WLH45860.1 RHS repeat-associated core domain-containing protein [Pseudomonas sp. FP2262]
MSSTNETLLCRYRYDPLDRLADCTPSANARTQRFYLKERLTSEIQASVHRSIFQQDDQLLAQQQRQDGTVETTLLATDQQRSVLRALDATQPHPLAYTPYGHRAPENGLLSLLGFNGERPDPVTGHYLLGNGYRAFNPVLMRFNSPDSLSPFGEGGLNAYAFCVGDPVNRTDPSGHFPNFLKLITRFLKPRTPSTRVPSTTPVATNSSPSGVQELIAPANGHSRSASVPPRQPSLRSLPQEPTYAQGAESHAAVQIPGQAGPLPSPPPNARLHTQSSSEPSFLNDSVYEEPPIVTVKRLERELKISYSLKERQEMIREIGVDRYRQALLVTLRTTTGNWTLG